MWLTQKFDAFQKTAGASFPALALAAGLLVTPLAPARAESGPMFAGYPKVAAEQLVGMRGGFLNGNGEGIRYFSFELATRINGLLVEDFALSLAADGSLSVTPPVAHDVTSAAGLVVSRLQLGEGNFAPGTFSGANGFIRIIQNSLDNLAIQQDARIRIDFAGAGLGRAALARTMAGLATLSQ